MPRMERPTPHIRIEMDMERETVNTIRFLEDKDPRKDKPTCGKIYVQQVDLETIGSPSRIRVTIEAA